MRALPLLLLSLLLAACGGGKAVQVRERTPRQVLARMLALEKGDPLQAYLDALPRELRSSVYRDLAERDASAELDKPERQLVEWLRESRFDFK